MSRSYPKILRNRKRRIERRLDPERRRSEQLAPMLSASNIHCEMAKRGRAVNYGGIGAIHLMGSEARLSRGDRWSGAVSKGRYPTMRGPCTSLARMVQITGWQHINLLGEYDFSDDKLQDSVGMKPPKLAA